MNYTGLKKSFCLDSISIGRVTCRHLQFHNYGHVGMVHRSSWPTSNQYCPCVWN